MVYIAQRYYSINVLQLGCGHSKNMAYRIYILYHPTSHIFFCWTNFMVGWNYRNVLLMTNGVSMRCNIAIENATLPFFNATLPLTVCHHILIAFLQFWYIFYSFVGIFCKTNIEIWLNIDHRMLAKAIVMVFL